MTGIILSTMSNEADQINTDSRIIQLSFNLTTELESLYKSSYKALVGFAILFILPREVAEEIVQEVFVETLARTQRDRTFSVENVEAFIKAAIAMKAKNKHRRNFLKAVKENQASEDIKTQYAPSNNENAFLDQISEAIDLLPSAQKECIVLKYYEQMKISEIAQFLKVTEGTVKTHLHRATTTLKTNILSIH